MELGWRCGWDDDDEGLMEAAEVCSEEDFCSQKTSEAPSAVGSLLSALVPAERLLWASAV